MQIEDEVAKCFAQSRRALVGAAAGCGKTELIAKAIGEHPDHRQLVLTHTHAGVRVLKDRLRKYHIPSKMARVETLAGFALRYAASFPRLSSLDIARPTDKKDWPKVYGAALQVLGRRSIRRVLLASYYGVYVDEYQDCIDALHEIVVRLAGILPCRIVGDPLQGIFDFNEPLPSWENQVRNEFPQIAELVVPHRWNGKNDALGEWLQELRFKLLCGESVSLRNAPIHWNQSTPQNRQNECFRSLKDHNGSVSAIFKWPNGCYDLGQKLKGTFACMEPIECNELMSFAKNIECDSGPERAGHVIEFAKSCIACVTQPLAPFLKKFKDGQRPTSNLGKKCATLREKLLAVADVDDIAAVQAVLHEIRRIPSARLYRRELWDEGLATLRNHATPSCAGLSETAWRVRDRARQHGRRVDHRCLTTTLLVKGLEFDHAIVLNADELDAKNLYVAMTRGSRTLTVLSAQPQLNPPAPTFT